MEKKFHPDRLNISEISHSEKGAYLKAYDVLFPKILLWPVLSRVLIAAQVCKIELSSYFSNIVRQIKLESMTIYKICSLRTVC